MPKSDNGWTKVWTEIQIRLREMRMTQADLIRLSGVSGTRLRELRDGVPLQREDKRQALCAALRWTDGSIEDILAGKAPTVMLVLPPGYAPASGDPLADLTEVERAQVLGYIAAIRERRQS